MPDTAAMLDDELRRALVRARRLEDEFERSGTAFEDPEFPPPTGPDAQLWLRPQELQRHDGRRLGPEEDWQLFRGAPRSEDVQQGALGDCWFLGPLASLAELQEGRFVRDLLPKQRRRNRAGAYVVRLCLGGRWRAVLLDDRLPCRASAAGGGATAAAAGCSGQQGGCAVASTGASGGQKVWGLAFCRTGRLQLWASLVEKGLAKLCGSYAATTGGFAGDAFPMITGWPCMGLGLDLPYQEEATWGLLSGLVAEGRLVGCSTRKDVEADGLQSEHVYTLLGAEEVAADPSLPEGGRLLRLRDPQKSSEWRGEWSDASARWTPALRERLGCQPGSGQETGVIFLSLEDFLARFSDIAVCEARGSDWSEQRVPLTPDGGPCQGLMLEAAKATECVASLCLPYEHALASKPMAWLLLLLVERVQPAASALVRLAARTRFARESTVSLEFVLKDGQAAVLVPFCNVPGRDGTGCNGAALDGMWACFSREPLRRCGVCRLTWESFERLEDASAVSSTWTDHGPRGLSGDTAPWGETFALATQEGLLASPA